MQAIIFFKVRTNQRKQHWSDSQLSQFIGNIASGSAIESFTKNRIKNYRTVYQNFILHKKFYFSWFPPSSYPCIFSVLRKEYLF